MKKREKPPRHRLDDAADALFVALAPAGYLRLASQMGPPKRQQMRQCVRAVLDSLATVPDQPGMPTQDMPISDAWHTIIAWLMDGD